MEQLRKISKGPFKMELPISGTPGEDTLWADSPPWLPQGKPLWGGESGTKQGSGVIAAKIGLTAWRQEKEKAYGVKPSRGRA